MARQVLPIVGLVVGAFFGAPQVGLAIGTLVGNAVDPLVVKGPKLGEAGLQTAAEGVFCPVVWGTAAVKGNVVCRGNRTVRTMRSQAGKGGGPVTEEQRVYWTFAIRLCEAEIQGVTRIWQDEKLVYDVRPESTISAESAEFAERFRLYLGDEDQLPDPDLEVFLGEGNAPAYRGRAYVVFPNFDLTDRRESIPDFRFEVTTAVTVIPIDKLDEENSPPSGGQQGGLPIGLGTHLGLKPWPEVPISMVEAYAYQSSSHPFLYCGFVRMQFFYQSGLIAFDSGWLGQASLQSELNDLLNDEGHPELIAPITDSPLTILFNGGLLKRSEKVTGEIYPEEPLGSIRTWWARTPTSQGATFGGHIEARMIDADDMPTGAVANPSTPGTVITPDGTIYAAPWGPDFVTQVGGSLSLSEVVAAIHHRAGQDASDYDVSELDDEVLGYVLAGDYTCADSIRTLMPAYFFDASEFDDGDGYRIHYVKRGKPVVLTLTEEDLLQAPEKAVREDALERPRMLHLHYENPQVGYVPAKATARRDSPDVFVVGERSLQIPVVFADVDQPAQVVDKLMKIAWTEVKGEEEFVTHDGRLELVPGDCIGVILRGQVRRMRIVQQEIGEGEMRLRLIADRQSAYTSTVTGVPLPPPTPPLPSIVGDTIYEFLDIPALNDGNDSLLWYEAASGQTSAWFGAQTQRRTAADTDFQNSARFSQNTIMGHLLEPITGASEHFTDTTNVVRVQLYSDDQIDSLTDTQFLSEGGSFALKREDSNGVSWEILQYRDAVDEGDGVFALSHLARGRLNTGATEHEVGARFVLLDGVQSVAATTSMIGTEIVTRAVSFGQSPDGVQQYGNGYEGMSQVEFPVANVLLSRAGDTVSIRIVPRHRFGTEMNPVRSINWNGFRVTATDGTNVTTVTTLEPTLDVDATGWASPVTVTVSQINRITGPGPEVSEQIA